MSKQESGALTVVKMANLRDMCIIGKGGMAQARYKIIIEQPLMLGVSGCM